MPPLDRMTEKKRDGSGLDFPQNEIHGHKHDGNQGQKFDGGKPEIDHHAKARFSRQGGDDECPTQQDEAKKQHRHEDAIPKVLFEGVTRDADQAFHGFPF